MEKKQTISRNSICYLLALVAPLCYFILFLMYMPDVPVNDDYTAILGFLDHYTSAASYATKLKLIFSQHNEHRIVYNRLLTLANYAATGKVNFVFLAALGNIALALLFVLYWRLLHNNQVNPLLLIPVSVLLFSIGGWENMTFAMAAMSNLTVVLFSMLSLYFITRQNIMQAMNLACSAIFMVLAVFTQGAGLCLLPLLTGILVYRNAFKAALLFGIISIVVLAVYFYNYQQPVQHHYALADSLLHFKVRTLLFIAGFIGNALNYYLIFSNDNAESNIVSIIIGFVLLAVYVYAWRKQYYRQNLFTFSIMTLVLLIACVTAATRSQMGLEMMGSSRNRVNGALFVCAVLWWLSDTGGLQTRVSKWLLVFGSLFIFVVISLNQYEYLAFRERSMMLEALRYSALRMPASATGEDGNRLPVLQAAAAKAYYLLPDTGKLNACFPYSNRCGKVRETPGQDQLRLSVDAVEDVGNSYLVSGWAFINGMGAAGEQLYIGLKRAGCEDAFYEAKQEPRFDLNPYFHKWNLRCAGYTARIKKRGLQTGDYKILVEVVNEGKAVVAETAASLHCVNAVNTDRFVPILFEPKDYFEENNEMLLAVWSNEIASRPVNTGTGHYTLTYGSRGTQALGVYPVLTVFVNSDSVYSFTAGEQMQTHSLSFVNTSDKLVIRFRLNNDYTDAQGKQDRNAFIRQVELVANALP